MDKVLLIWPEWEHAAVLISKLSPWIDRGSHKVRVHSQGKVPPHFIWHTWGNEVRRVGSGGMSQHVVERTCSCGHSGRGMGSARVAPHSGEGDLGHAGRAAALPLGQLLRGGLLCILAGQLLSRLLPTETLLVNAPPVMLAC